MTGETYTCAICGGVFEKDAEWTDEAAMAEAKKMGFREGEDEPAVCCNDCFQAIESNLQAFYAERETKQ